MKKYYNLYYRGWLGLFFPQYNLVCIKERENMEESIEHEFFHSYTTSLNPSYLFPFYNELCDIRGEPHAVAEMENFRDIVEVLFVVYQKVAGKISDFTNVRINKEYIPLAEEIIMMKNDLLRYGVPNSGETNLEIEAFNALVMLFLHIIPQGDNYGKRIAKFFRENLPITKWKNRNELFFKLYFLYNQLLEDRKHLASLYKLAFPFDYHRFIGEMFIFLRATVWILQTKDHEKLLPFLLSLIYVFSLGSLMILPVFFVEEQKKRIRIEIMHSTETAEGIIRDVIKTMENGMPRGVIKNKDNCFYVLLFKQIFQETQVFRASKDKNRLKNFIEFFLNMIEDKLYNIKVEKYDCEICKSTYNSTILPYEKIMTVRLKQYKHLLVELGEKYENWLKSKAGIEWMGDELLKESLSGYTIETKYEYL